MGRVVERQVAAIREIKARGEKNNPKFGAQAAERGRTRDGRDWGAARRGGSDANHFAAGLRGR